MTTSPATSNSNQTPQKEERFYNIQVDNDGFFDTVEKALPKLLNVDLIHSEARKEIHILLANMRKEHLISGAKKWTAQEQQKFYQRLRSEIDNFQFQIQNAGILYAKELKTTLQKLIIDEIDSGLAIPESPLAVYDGGGNILAPLSDMEYFLKTSFLSEGNTSIVAVELHLLFEGKDTVGMAKEKLEKYQGFYNAIILVDESKRPIGIIHQTSLENIPPDTPLSSVETLKGIQWTYSTSVSQAIDIMARNSINILPIVDSKNNSLIGILSLKNAARKETQYFTQASLTQMKVEQLKSQFSA